MHVQPSREDMIELTALNPFERFPDGRPRVPDNLIERMKLVTTEEAWSVLRHHGYHRQFAGNWRETHPGTITVGRAVTAYFLPHRPDFHTAIQQARPPTRSAGSAPRPREISATRNPRNRAGPSTNPTRRVVMTPPARRNSRRAARQSAARGPRGRPRATAWRRRLTPNRAKSFGKKTSARRFGPRPRLSATNCSS